MDFGFLMTPRFAVKRSLFLQSLKVWATIQVTGARSISPEEYNAGERLQKRLCFIRQFDLRANKRLKLPWPWDALSKIGSCRLGLLHHGAALARRDWTLSLQDGRASHFSSMGAAAHSLIESGSHPMLPYVLADGSVPGMWSEGQWIEYLDSEEPSRMLSNTLKKIPSSKARKRSIGRLYSPSQAFPAVHGSPTTNRIETNARAVLFSPPAQPRQSC